MRRRKFNNNFILAGWQYRPIGNIISATVSEAELSTYQQYETESIYPIYVPNNQYIYIGNNEQIYNSIPILEKINYLHEPILSYSVQNTQNYAFFLQQKQIPEAYTGLLYSQLYGNRIRLTWEKCTDNDFGAYLIYWDNGSGTIDTLLYSSYDRSVCEYLTSELAAGTYKFQIQYQDFAGNIGVYGGIDPSKDISIVVNTIPDTPDLDWEYDQETRKLIIDSTNTNIVLHANYIIGCAENNGFTSFINYTHCFPTTISDAIYSQELFPGKWKFAVHEVNKFGVYSAKQEINFTLIESVGELIKIDTIINPTELAVEKLANAVLKITWYPALPADTEETTYSVNVYSSTDNVTYTLIDTTVNNYYNFSGVNNTTYYFYVKFSALTGSIQNNSDMSPVAYDTADSDPPVGTQNIYAQLI